MLAGRMRHGDNQGNVGLLRPGSVQWMTAGRGIVHSEMPEQEDGLMRGFQLWVNLPAKDKMTEPRYQDIDPENVPVVERADGTKVQACSSAAFGGVERPGHAASRPSRSISTSRCRPARVRACRCRRSTTRSPTCSRARRGSAPKRSRSERGELAVLGLGRRRAVEGGREGRPPDPGRRPAAARAGGEIRAVRHEHAGTRSARRSRTIRRASSSDFPFLSITLSPRGKGLRA